LRPKTPLQDGERFRARLLAHFESLPVLHDNFAEVLRFEGGIEVHSGYGGCLWPLFFKENPIVEILDAIGLIAEALPGPLDDQWKKGVARIFQEQAMAYRLDKGGAVRRLIDTDFERNQYATIAGLGGRKFKVAKGYFDQAGEALEKTPPDTAGMVRNVFLANEEVFKLMFPAVDRLVAGNVRNHLKPENSVSTQSAKTASQEMANSFAKWVAACQQYRHAPGEVHQGGESPAAPPLDLAIVMMSNGTSFLRWLISLESAGKK
jgi:hypothetical protein